jgi:hypothetical protein
VPVGRDRVPILDIGEALFYVLLGGRGAVGPQVGLPPAVRLLGGSRDQDSHAGRTADGLVRSERR